MNLGQMQTEVALMLRNMKSSHPFYPYIYPAAGAESTSVINKASNRLVRMALGANKYDADLFPELRQSWTIGPTVVGQNSVARPTDCIAVQSVVSARSSTLPSWPATQEYPVSFVSATTIGLMTKPGNADYPALWSLKGRSILYSPTTQAGFTDYFRVYGLKAEDLLVNPTDTLFMDTDWHDLVVTLAASILAGKMGLADRSASWRTAVENELKSTQNVTNLQAQPGLVMVEGMPTRESVYGGSNG